MKVSELRSKIEAWDSEGKVGDQTVEFIVSTKKHFAKDVKAGVNTLSIDVTRSQYTPLTLSSLKTNLTIASSDTDITITQKGKEMQVEDLYLSSDFLEFVLA